MSSCYPPAPFGSRESVTPDQPARPHVWRSPRTLSRRDGPGAALRGWLLDPGSLTGHLRGYHGEALGVEVLAEEDTTPAPGEMARLDLPDGPAFVRRVALGRHGCPLVLARTVMPPPTLRGEGRRLRNLGDTPLGELVFADFAATRSEFELASLAPPSPLFPELDTVCWARRSVLHLATGPILVTEAFLPHFPGSGIEGA